MEECKMSVNIYDTANQLERDLRSLPEFLAVKDAYDKVKENEVSYELFKAFQQLQFELQQKQMTGEEITQEDSERSHEIAAKIQTDELIAELMQKEQMLSTIINDLNQVIMRPIQELYAE